MMMPIKLTAGTMRTLKNAKVIPTARASMLVAMARINMVFISREAFSGDSSLESASFIMVIPIKDRKTKATQ